MLSGVFMLMTFVVFVGYGLFAAVDPRPRHLAPPSSDLDAAELCRRICRARRQARIVQPLTLQYGIRAHD